VYYLICVLLFKVCQGSGVGLLPLVILLSITVYLFSV